ncbi:hypothetical protein [Nostoc sp.]|uniref:hypothetical protein n=1 Tax=Nostoc sp. TaxID=1180 RepID=UPI002FFAAEE7
MKQDLVSWYDNNINHPQRSLKQLLGIFYQERQRPGGRRNTASCPLPSSILI